MRRAKRRLSRVVSKRVNTIVTKDSNKSFNHRAVVASAIEFSSSHARGSTGSVGVDASRKESFHGARAIESFVKT